MKIFFANLNPCNTRKVNIRQYMDFVDKSNHEIVDSQAEADIIFVWGCEFRADWRDFSFLVAKELKQNNPAKIVYIGCTFDNEFTSKIKSELDIEVVPWRDRKKLFENILSENKSELKNTKLKLAENKLVESAVEHRKKHPLDNICFEDEYVKLNICEGCTNNCSYCSERQMFPVFRSFVEDDLINDCKKATKESDTNRVMFLADSSGEYGKDTGSSLPQLINRLKEEIRDDIKIGISQLNPEHFLEYYEQMMKLIEEGTIIYLNIPIQSVSDKILSSMRRKYNYKQIDKLFSDFNKIKFNNFSTHLLFGYPGESESDVEKSINFVIKHSPRHVVASAFMPHSAIEASEYENQISEEDVKKRIKKCEEKLTENGIAVATDWGSVTNKIMNRIRHSLNLDLKDYNDNQK